MSALIGCLLALVAVIGARLLGFERDRAFYPTLVIAVASYDVVFGTFTSSPAVIAAEIALAIGFIAIAVLGFRYSPLWVIVGLAVHGLADVTHTMLIPNDGIPQWWPGYCVSFDWMASFSLSISMGFSAYQRRRRRDSYDPRPTPSVAPPASAKVSRSEYALALRGIVPRIDSLEEVLRIAANVLAGRMDALLGSNLIALIASELGPPRALNLLGKMVDRECAANQSPIAHVEQIITDCRDLLEAYGRN